MVICHHTVRASEIAGIGPLIVQRSNDPMQAQLYNNRVLWFYLILKKHSFKIKSETISFAGHLTAEELEKSKARYREFVEGYEQAKKRIERMIEFDKREQAFNTF